MPLKLTVSFPGINEVEMAERTKKKPNRAQRKRRLYQVIFVVISVTVLLTMILSLVVN